MHHKFELTKTGKELIDRIKDWKAFERDFERIVRAVVREIIKRTKAGTDANGNSFKPYTAGYAAWKFGAKKRGGFTSGKKKQLKASNTIRGAYSNFGNVDLTLSGAMLNSMPAATKITTQGRLFEGRVSVGSNETDKALGVSKKRKFVGLDPSLRQKVIGDIRKAVINSIKRKS